MRLPYVVLLTLSLICASPAAASEACRALTSLDWLLGNWRAIQEQATVSERWQRVSPHTFEGTGITDFPATEKPTQVESLRLVEMSGEIFYLAKIDSNPRPVSFKMTRCRTGQATFENADHDFPQRLDYQLQSDGTLRVAVTDMRAKGFEILFMRQHRAEQP